MAFNYKSITTLPEIPVYETQFETVITELSDLPEPIANKIQLEDDITYRFQGIVDIGDNYIEAGNSNTVFGFDKSSDGVIYTGTGATFRCNNQTISVKNIIIIANSGSAFEVNNNTTYSLQVSECILAGTGSVATITGGNLIIFNNNIVSSTVTGGILVQGTCIKVALAFNFFENETSTYQIQINGGSYDIIKIIDNDFTISTPYTSILVTGLAIITNNGGGSIISNSFSGTGTYIDGIQDDTLDWIIEANGAEVLSTSGRRFIRKIRNEEQLFNFLAEPNPSDYVYEIDGIINVTQSISVPSTGLTFKGYGNNFSTITTDVTGLTIFTGSGNAFFNDLRLSCTGSGSTIFNMTSATGFEAVEFVNVNFENCEDIGILDGFRQGLLLNGFMLGVKEGLLFRGTWSGGFRIDASRFIFTETGSTYMFKGDTGQTFANRFVSNANTTVASGATAYDFTPTNFINDATFQLIEAQFNGSGIYVNPAITASSIKSLWRDNVGIDDTFQGIVTNNTTTTTTTIALVTTYYELECVSNVIESAWFSSGSGTTFSTIYDSTLPINISIEFFLSLTSSNNNQIEIEIRNYRTSLAGGYDSLGSFKLTTNGGAAGTRVESTSLKTFDRVELNDNIRVFVRNNTGANDVDLDSSSKFIITKR